MFDQFSDLVVDASGWAFAVIIILAALDAVIPAVPSETALVTAGVIAASNDLSALPMAILGGAAGAFAGDNLAYVIGYRYGSRKARRFLRSEKSERRVAWAAQQLGRRGGQLITAGRFVPGGRTAVTLTAGLTRFPWTRFAIYDALAGLLWAAYSASLGYFGGHAFEHQPWKGLLLALGIAATATLGIWSGGRLLRKVKSTCV
jgi:membrane protein DedA with SNARE-associated domain